jgi:hypothetical protein
MQSVFYHISETNFTVSEIQEMDETVIFFVKKSVPLLLIDVSSPTVIESDNGTFSLSFMTIENSPSAIISTWSNVMDPSIINTPLIELTCASKSILESIISELKAATEKK